MNYQKIYDQFIADRKSKESSLTGYTERHHIIPKSLGGSDDPSNLVRLSAGDHYFAHCCLAKAKGGTQWAALWMVAGNTGSKKMTRRQLFSKRRMVNSAREKMKEAISGKQKGVPRPSTAGENNPAKRSDVREKLKEVASRKEVKEKKSVASLAYYAKDGSKELASISSKAMWNRPGMRELFSALRKDKWSDEDFKLMMKEKNKKTANSDAVKEAKKRNRELKVEFCKINKIALPGKGFCNIDKAAFNSWLNTREQPCQSS